MPGLLVHALSAAEWLFVWERGRSETPTRRTTMLLAAVCRDATPEELDRLTMGRRDECLLTLRESTFGPLLQSVCRCPECGEELEMAFHASDLRQAQAPEEAEALEFADHDYAVRFRLPTGGDLAALPADAGLAANRLHLLENCVLDARRAGQAVAAKDLPNPIVEAIQDRMAQADPQADLKLDLTCPACTHRWDAVFDIGSFFWGELNAWALRILREIHLLATAYGWTETDILALSPLRRQAYLEMVGS